MINDAMRIRELQNKVDELVHYTSLLENQLKDSEKSRDLTAQGTGAEQVKITRLKAHVTGLEQKIVQQRERLRVLETNVVDKNAKVTGLERALRRAIPPLHDDGRYDPLVMECCKALGDEPPTVG